MSLETLTDTALVTIHNGRRQAKAMLEKSGTETENQWADDELALTQAEIDRRGALKLPRSCGHING